MADQVVDHRRAIAERNVEAILDAAERGDAPASEATMRTHLTEVLAVLEPLRQRYPDLFEPDER